MTYCAFCDPGQCKKSQVFKNGDDELSMPKRAHKTWQYKRPVRRYDHYCRWLSNCIGLLNHREFVVMCFGLVMIGMCGTMMDAILVFFSVRQGRHGVVEFFII